MSEMSYDENQSQEHDYSQDVCEPGDDTAPEQAAPAHEPHEIYDPPIEHDPIGQALLTLPLSIAQGVEEVAVWGASEVAIGVGELLFGDDEE